MKPKKDPRMAATTVLWLGPLEDPVTAATVLAVVVAAEEATTVPVPRIMVEVVDAPVMVITSAGFWRGLRAIGKGGIVHQQKYYVQLDLILFQSSKIIPEINQSRMIRLRLPLSNAGSRVALQRLGIF